MNEVNEVNILTLDDIQAGIHEFINSSDYQYSIFINGEWGIGKTYFINKTLKKNTEDSLRYVYVSLFGVASIQELDEKISTELLLQAFDMKKYSESNLGKLGTMLGKTARNIILKKLSLTPEDFPKNSDWADLVLQDDDKKFLFIFDDIERSSCQMKDLLGYINIFIEQYGAKVILIGCQPKIDFTGDVNKTESNCKQDNNGVLSSYSPSNEQSIYSQYEEKLIGYKINFNPDFDVVAYEFIQSLTEKLKIENEIGVGSADIFKVITSVFGDANEHNLRKFQNIVGTIGRLFKSLTDPKNRGLFSDQEYLKQFFMIAIIQIAYSKLSKRPTQRWAETNWQFALQLRSSFPLYIETFVKSSIMPQSEFERAIMEFIEKCDWDKENERDPLNLLRNGYPEIENHQILTELYTELLKNLKTSYYPPNKWGDILVLISKLESELLIDKGEFLSVIDEIERQVKLIAWDSQEYKNYYFNVEYFVSDITMLEEHKETLYVKFAEWGDFKKLYLFKNMGESIQQFFENNDMQGLKAYIESNQNDIYINRHLLSFIDWETIKSFLSTASPRLYQGLRAAIFVIYVRSGFMDTDEKQILNTIIEWCEQNTNTGDKLILMQRRWLMANLVKVVGSNHEMA